MSDNSEALKVLARDAGWTAEDRGDALRLGKPGLQLAIEKDLASGAITREIRPVDVGKLNIEPRLQRLRNDARVAYLAAHWSPPAVGTLKASERSNGTLWLLDGQHRKAAMERVGDKSQVDCLVFKGLSLPQEAFLFDKFNDRYNVHPITRYKARLLAGEPVETEVEATLNLYAVRTAWHAAEGYACVGSLLKAHSYGKDVLRDVIELLEACWPEDLARRKPIVVDALAELRRVHPDLDMDRAIKRFERHNLNGLIQAAKSDKAEFGGKGVAWWLARRLQQIYDKGRSKQS